MDWRILNLQAQAQEWAACSTSPCLARLPDCWTVSGSIPPTTTESCPPRIRIILLGRLRRTHGKCFNQDRDTGLFDRVPIYSGLIPPPRRFFFCDGNGKNPSSCV